MPRRRLFFAISYIACASLVLIDMMAFSLNHYLFIYSQGLLYGLGCVGLVILTGYGDAAEITPGSTDSELP